MSALLKASNTIMCNADPGLKVIAPAIIKTEVDSRLTEESLDEDGSESEEEDYGHDDQENQLPPPKRSRFLGEMGVNN